MAVRSRLGGAIRRHGVAGTLLLALGSARRRAYLREEHVWYELHSAAHGRRLALPTGLELLRAEADDLPLVESLSGVRVEAARVRLKGGTEVWLVVESGVPAFCCWIYRDRAPVVAARGGWLTLLQGVACLEDSFTSAAHRGRGIAPAAWNAIADDLACRGADTVITKIEIGNAPSRRAVEKAGFEEIALMSLWRVGPRARVEVKPSRSTPVAGTLRALLAR